MHRNTTGGIAGYVLLIALAGAILSAPALYNGFPLVAWDTVSYLTAAIEGEARWARPIVYSLLIYPLHLEATLWPVIFVQGFILSFVIHTALHVTIGRVSPMLFAGAILALTSFSSLPWLSSEIMADALAAIVPLGLYIVAFGGDRLSRWQLIGTICVTSLAIAVHNSYLPMSAGLIIGIAGLKLILGDRLQAVLKTVAAACVPLIMAMAVLMTTNFVYTGKPTLSSHGQVFVLARFIEDDTAGAYLRDNCGQENFALCEYLDEFPMPHWVFLWRSESPMSRLGGAAAISDEAKAIVIGSVLARPVRHFKNALKQTVLQLQRFETGRELVPLVDEEHAGDKWVPLAIKKYFPGSYERYLSSRQSLDQLQLEELRRAHHVAILLALFLIGATFLGVRTRSIRPFFALSAVVAGSLLLNAAISGSLSIVDDRYQARLVWLLVFLAIVGARLLFLRYLWVRRPFGR